MKTTRIDRIGVDVGFGYSKLVWYDEDGKVHVLVIPSVLGRSAQVHQMNLGLGGPRQRRVFKVGYEGEEYFVGDDALLHSQTGLASTQAFGRIGSSEERILLLALLAKAGLTDVCLVTGLPVLAWDLRHKLRRSWEGQHQVSLGRKELTITVREVRTAWQPVLSLYDYALAVEVGAAGLEVKLANGMDNEKLRKGWLVIDVGHNTTDKAGVIDLQPIDQYSGGALVGGRDILAVIQKAIEQEYGVHRSIAQIERDLRRGRMDVYNREVNLLPLARSAAGSLAAQVATEVSEGMGDGSQFHGVLVTGGPAEVVKPAIMTAFPRNQVVALPDSQIANARGGARWGLGPGVFKCLK